MTNNKDSAVLADRVERVTKWLDGGCSTWGTPMQDIREILNALRQPTQSDALLTKMNKWCEAVAVEWGQGSQTHNIARDAVDIVRAALQEQSK